MSQTLCMARVYLRRRTEKPGRGLIGWLFARPLARILAEDALASGAVYATVTLGHMGFVQGARAVEQDIAEIPSSVLPTCLEVVAPRGVLDAFIASRREELKDATVVVLEGVEISVPASAAPSSATTSA